MSMKMDDSTREEIALFRYGLIVSLLNPEELEWGMKGELARRIAAQNHTIPNSAKHTIGSDTIRKWVAAYKKNGFEGLKPKPRSDTGQMKTMPADAWEMAVRLRCEAPGRSVAKIIRIMEQAGLVKPGQLKRSTLSLHFKKHGYDRKSLGQKATVHRRFQADHPNQIWQSDIMYGPWLPDPRQPEKTKRTYLVAFIDDRSRLAPHAEFYWDERYPRLENTLRKAVLRRGLPRIIYVDNGAVYSTRKLDAICASLGIRKISCQPYSPQGKGKVERFFETVRNGFLVEPEVLAAQTLAELNRLFWGWLEVEYHQQTHSATKQTPLQGWQQIGKHLRTVDAKELAELFLYEVNRTVDNAGLVKVEGIAFEIDALLAKKKVQVRYNPFDLSWVKVYNNGALVGKAWPLKAGRWNTARRKAAQAKDKPDKDKPPSGLKPMKQLVEQLGQRQQGAQHQSSGRTQPFTLPAFIKTVATALNRQPDAFHPAEVQTLKHFLESYPQLTAVTVSLILAKAIINHGGQKHISVYLDIIKQHLTATFSQKEN
jgi:transposase InsO family protein